MIKIYFAAFVGTLFLTIIGGVAIEATVLSVLELLHVPQVIEQAAGLFFLLFIFGFFFWYFPKVVEVEKALADQTD